MQVSEPTLPKIEDVAAAAGVSISTVSRVLNKPEVVRESLRRKVQQAIVALGYVPNAGARAMMLKRSGTVGAIFPTVDNTIFAKAIDALQKRFAVAGLQLLLATSDYDPNIELTAGQSLLTSGVDGLVLCGCAQRPELLQLLSQRRIPAVHVMSWPSPQPGLITVGFDNARATKQVVRYLLDLGHRRISMLAGITRNNDRAAARVAGVRDALEEVGLELSLENMIERRYEIAAAREGLRTLLRVKIPPTAVICGNDVLAIGALLEAQSMGIDVPGGLSVVGFDDLDLAAHIPPGLTTVQIPMEQMWRTAAERMIQTLQGREAPLETQLEIALVVRGSTAPPMK